jgi:hypothetical protein
VVFFNARAVVRARVCFLLREDNLSRDFRGIGGGAPRFCQVKEGKDTNQRPALLILLTDDRAYMLPLGRLPTEDELASVGSNLVCKDGPLGKRLQKTRSSSYELVNSARFRSLGQSRIIDPTALVGP